MSGSVSLAQDVPGLALTEGQVGLAVDAVLSQEGVQRDCLVSVSVVGDDDMAGLNLEWRGQDRPTDVLSLECERPDDPDLAPGEPCELGDIVLAPSYISAQATRLGTSEVSETALLLVHGMLHLLGYDHLDDDEARVMESREDAIVASLPFVQGSDHVELTRHRGERP